MATTITIDDEDLALIKKVLAYPQVDNLLLSDDQIKTLIISVILRNYFTKFPLLVENTYSVNSETEINFPDEYTFGVVDARVLNTGFSLPSGTSFWDLIRFNMFQGNDIVTKSTYGQNKYNPSALKQTNLLSLYQAQSIKNTFTSVSTRVDNVNKKLKVFSSIAGTLYVLWAKYSLNFNDVRYERKNDVIALCQAELLDHLADATSILSDSAIEISINSDALRSRATELRDKVYEKWDEENQIIFLHVI